MRFKKGVKTYEQKRKTPSRVYIVRKTQPNHHSVINFDKQINKKEAVTKDYQKQQKFNKRKKESIWK